MQLAPEEVLLLLLGPGQGVADVVVPGSDVGGGRVPVEVDYAGRRRGRGTVADREGREGMRGP